MSLVFLLSTTQPVLAQDQHSEEEPSIELSSNIGVVSDYRFRGISLSDRDPAIQGGIDLTAPSGLFAGVWASSIAPYGGAEGEVDLYVGYGAEIGSLEYSVTANAYLYPGGQGVNYGELQANLGKTLGPVKLGAEVAYVPDQKNTQGGNVYLGMSLDVPLGKTPLILKSRGGYEDGFYDSKWDWEVGVAYEKEWGVVFLSALGTNYSGALEADSLGKTGVVAGATLNF